MNAFVTGTDRDRIQAHLAPDEELLWVGKPELTLWCSQILFYFFICAIATCVACVAVHQNVANLQARINMQGVILIGMAAYLGLAILELRLHSRWLYALTNKRALVQTHRELRTYEIKPYMVLSSRVPEHGAGKLVFEVEGEDGSRQEWGFMRCRGLAEPLQLLEDMLDGHALENSKSPDLRKQEKEADLMKLAQEPHIGLKLIGISIIMVGMIIGSLISMQHKTWDEILFSGALIVLLVGSVGGGICGLLFYACRRGKRLLREKQQHL